MARDPRTLTTDTERTTAHALAADDPRLAYALADPDRVGFAQTLAGAHELVEHYRTAPPLARLLLEAAADARRLGHRQALTIIEVFSPGIHTQLKGAVGVAGQGFGESSATCDAGPWCRLRAGGTRHFAGAAA
jgi:hypothetical protein